MSWQDLVGPLIVIFFVIVVVIALGIHMRRKNDQREAYKAHTQERSDNFRDLQSFLREKVAYDLVDADNKTVPYLKAFIEILEMSGTIDELRPIAEVYRYRKGFNDKWIGE